MPTSRRILVVDDNIDAADSLAMLLSLQGHQVCAAYDGLGAVSLAGDFLPEVALLDIGLPRLDGLEVARRIRSADWGRHMRLVALTGWSGRQLEAAFEAGFDHHLMKPVELGRLDAILHQGGL
ncbi:MAG: response regulator [Burkholderiaceae bacterium]